MKSSLPPHLMSELERISDRAVNDPSPSVAMFSGLVRDRAVNNPSGGRSANRPADGDAARAKSGTRRSKLLRCKERVAASQAHRVDGNAPLSVGQSFCPAQEFTPAQTQMASPCMVNAGCHAIPSAGRLAERPPDGLFTARYEMPQRYGTKRPGRQHSPTTNANASDNGSFTARSRTRLLRTARNVERSLHQFSSVPSIFFSVFLCLCLLRPASAQQQFITEYQLDTSTVEIPFEYRQHQILVHGSIGTRQNLTFLFDTGATAPVLDTSLGVRGRHLADPTIQEAEGQTKAEEIWLDELELGSTDHAARVRNIAVLQLDLSTFAHALGEHVDGIIGITFAAGFVCEIDYQKHVLRLRDPRTLNLSLQKADNQRTFLFDVRPVSGRRQASSVLVSGLLAPKYDYDFLFDTGFGGYVSVANAAAREAGLINDDTPRVVATSYSLNNHFRSEKVRAEFLSLGEINLSRKIVQVDYRNGDVTGQWGIVGNRFLQNYRVTLDYPHRKLWLERATTKEEPDEAVKPSFGLVLKAIGKSVRVDRVKKYSPAQKSGVRAGDEIIAINGQAVSQMSLQEVTSALAEPQGECQFQLRHGADPNLGTGGDGYVLNLTPVSPLDWAVN